ncbi:nucleotide pyrophosphohydrolase [Candidatus Dojkabacteria bacterium]|uniref:Nucleotide pyrophosphohydrolase n=1 Tax=Candidatus Dojkabacteria bacterium TaxID=2099670 RepID=A0A955LA92_9BACT|nr:nucleotide pyrophosphohydrolase [Candidatus Dojkabacteria bacterium]
MNYKLLKKELDIYRKARGWDKNPPVDLAKSVIIEAAEILEHFQWDETLRLKGTEVSVKDKNLEEISDEIADVVIYLFALCDQLNVDLVDITASKLEKVKLKYPAGINDKDYMKRKMEYRKKRKGAK